MICLSFTTLIQFNECYPFDSTLRILTFFYDYMRSDFLLKAFFVSVEFHADHNTVTKIR